MLLALVLIMMNDTINGNSSGGQARSGRQLMMLVIGLAITNVLLLTMNYYYNGPQSPPHLRLASCEPSGVLIICLLGHIRAEPRRPHSVRVCMIGGTSLADGPRARDVGFTTLYLDCMGEVCFEHVGLAALLFALDSILHETMQHCIRLQVLQHCIRMSVLQH